MVNICWFEKCTDTVPRSVYWHNTCILYENPNIDLNTSPSLQSICPLKNVSVAINLRIRPLHGNVLTCAAGGGHKRKDCIKWYRDTLRRETDSEREWAGNLFCLIMYMLNGTHSPSDIISAPPLNLVVYSLRKENFTKEVSRELQECFVEGLSLLLLHLSFPLFLSFLSALCLSVSQCVSASLSLCHKCPHPLCPFPILSFRLSLPSFACYFWRRAEKTVM